MELIMLVGIPGSGKSTIAKYYEEQGYRIHSSDTIRKEIYGQEEIQGNRGEVFSELIRRMREDLRKKRPCVMDATNLSRKRRRNFMSNFNGIPCNKTCLIILASPSVCMERNEKRARNVPEEKIYQMLCAFETPYYYEGWDRIAVVYTGAAYVFPREEAMALSQDNPHHTLSLGRHMEAARNYCIANGFSPAVREAAWYHDIGKLYTKRFANRKGEATQYAHFYGHENYGAWLYLCEKTSGGRESGTGTEYDDGVESGAGIVNGICTGKGFGIDNGVTEEDLYIANLINWHMIPLNVWTKSPARVEKDRALLGEAMFEDIRRLHLADVHGH